AAEQMARARDATSGDGVMHLLLCLLSRIVRMHVAHHRRHRGSANTGGGEERPRVAPRPLDQLGGVREVCGGDVERARRPEQDQPGAILERADLQDEPLLDEEGERVKPHAEGTARGGAQMASIACREDIDLRRAKLDRVRDGRVVRNAAVDQVVVAPTYRRGDGGGRPARARPPPPPPPPQPSPPPPPP